MTGKFIEQDGKSYPIVGKSKLLAGGKGCYQIKIDSARTAMTVKLLAEAPVTGMISICFGMGTSDGSSTQCEEGHVPACRNEKLACLELG